MRNVTVFVIMTVASPWFVGCNRPEQSSPAPQSAVTAQQAQTEPPPPGALPGALPPAPAPGEAESARPVPAPVTPRATLEKGRRITGRTTTALSSSSAASGDSFELTLHEPLMDGSRVVAPRGATLTGKVASVDRGGRVKGRARLSVRLSSLQLPDGKRVSLATTAVVREARSTRRRDAVKIGVGSAAGAAISAIAGGGRGAAIGAGAGGAAGTGVVLATRGEPAVIPAETILTFRLTQPVSF